MVLHAHGGDRDAMTDRFRRTLIGDRTETQRPAPDETRRVDERWLSKMREVVDGDDTVPLDSAAAVMADLSPWNSLPPAVCGRAEIVYDVDGLDCHGSYGRACRKCDCVVVWGGSAHGTPREGEPQ